MVHHYPADDETVGRRRHLGDADLALSSARRTIWSQNSAYIAYFKIHIIIFTFVRLSKIHAHVHIHW